MSDARYRRTGGQLHTDEAGPTWEAGPPLLKLLDTRWFHRLPEGVTVVNDWQELVISLLVMCVLWDPFGRGRWSTTLRPGCTATLEATQPLVVFSANYVSPWRLPNN